MEKDGGGGTRKDIVDVNSNTLHPSILSMCVNGQWNATIENYKCTRKFASMHQKCYALLYFNCFDIKLSLITR